MEYTWEQAGIERRRRFLCVVGAREDGEKELVGMELGYRESKESWAGVLRSLKDREMDAPLLAIGDGALGLWAALNEAYPTTAHQRCWNHRSLNLAARLPKSMQSSSRRRLREISHAPTRSECERLRDRYVSELRSEGRTDAAETVLRDWDDFVSFYDFPTEHWGPSADDQPDGVGVQRGETEDGRGAPDEATGQRVVPGVQGGTETLGAMAAVVWR